MKNFWLNAAFYQAKFAQGNTGRNPAVGCVIVNKNKVVGVGHTSINGRPHAEENALNMAGSNSLGGTLYVTLEPCNLKDNQNSCSNLIIKSGVREVVMPMLDHNKKTFKRGYKSLLKAGIKVTILKTTLSNFLINYPHYIFHKNKRPMVTIKLATSADGKITYENGESKWITNKTARNHVHQLRSLNDAILVGYNTVEKDNPTLNTRIEGYKSKNYRVILDKDLKIKVSSNLVKTIKSNPLIIFTNKENNHANYKILIKLGANVISIPSDSRGYLSVKAIINKLHKLGIQKLMIEGGAKVATSFIKENLVYFIYNYRSDKFIGSRGLHLFDNIECNNSFRIFEERKLINNTLEVWINKNINLKKCLLE